MNVTMGRIFLMERRTRAFYGVEFSLVMGKHFEFLCTPGKKSHRGGFLWWEVIFTSLGPEKTWSLERVQSQASTSFVLQVNKSQHKTKVNTKQRSMQKNWHKTKVNAKKIDKNKSQHEKVDTKQKPTQNKGQHQTNQDKTWVIKTVKMAFHL